MLCALDYGLAQGVDDAIIHLVRAGTIGAIACLPVSDLWPKSAPGLQAFLKQAHKRPIVGLCLTLTGEFSPLSTGFNPDNRDHQGYLPRLEDLARAARRFELQEAPLEAEFRAQFRRFTAHLGRKPDFLVLQTEILSFGPASRAVTATLAKFETKGLPVICPFLPLPTSFKDRLIKRYAWKANDQLREPWVRRAMMEVQEPGRLPPRSSWLQDGKVWSAIRPAFEDDRLKRFDKDPMMRVHQLSWL